MNYREGKSHRHCRIHGIAARLHHFDAGTGGKFMHADNDGMLRMGWPQGSRNGDNRQQQEERAKHQVEMSPHSVGTNF